MSTESAPGRSPELHPSALMGLLPYLSANAMDEDYEQVAREGGQDTPGRAVAAGLVAALFAVLVLVAASTTSSEVRADDTAREDLVAQLQQGRASLAADQVRVQSLRKEVATLRNDVLGSTKLSAQTRAQLSTLGVAAGTTAVRGPGLVMEVDDAVGATSDRNTVLDMDLQRIVNGLWEAGAEAISINGQRLGALSAIRGAGAAITVNYKSLSRPYVITAIGDRARMPGRFAETTSGRAWLDVQRRVKLRFELHTEKMVEVPAMPTKTLRHATRIKGAKK